MDYLLNMPFEVLLVVFRYLTIQERARIRLLNRFIYYKLEPLLPEPPKKWSANPGYLVRAGRRYSTMKVRCTLTSESSNFVRISTLLGSDSPIIVPLEQELTELTFGSKDTSNPKRLIPFADKINDFLLLTSNQYGTRPAITKSQLYIPRPTPYFYCFNSTAKVHMYDGSTKECQEIKIGDILRGASENPTEVKRVKKTEIHGLYKMVKMNDFWITRGHPIYVNGDWYRPDELYPLEEVYIDTLYNFYAEPEQFIVVGEVEPVTCSSLGGYCPRLATLDPLSDIIYGRGYGSKQAESYSWLLQLTERIPDHLVVPKEPVYYEALIPGRENIHIDVVFPERK
jgi:hypothetical protein